MVTPSEPGLLLGDARAQVVDVARRMVRDGLVVGTSGNVSLRAGKYLAVTPSGVDYDTLTPADIVVVDTTGAVVDGSLHPTSELPLHLLCVARHDAGAVVHTHSAAAVAVSLVRDRVPLVHYETAAFGGPVSVAEYAPFGSDELAANVSAALGQRTAAVMRHHGTLCLGSTLAKAYDGARQLEWMCDVWLRAAAVGNPALLPEDEITRIVARMADYGTRSGR